MAVSKGAFLHIEEELRDYHQTRRDIIRMINDAGSELPTASRARKVLALHSPHLIRHLRITAMEKTVTAIDAVMDRLPAEKQELIKLKYWTGGHTWNTLAKQLNYSTKVVKRWHVEIMNDIAVELGWA